MPRICEICGQQEWQSLPEENHFEILFLCPDCSNDPMDTYTEDV